MPLPKKEGHAYQVPTPKDGGAHVITTSTTEKVSNSRAFAVTSPCIQVYFTTDVYYRLSDKSGEGTAVGDIPTSADWHFLPASQIMHLGIAGDTKPARTYIHTLAVTSAGTGYISESD